MSDAPTERSHAATILVAAAAALGGFLFGYDTAIINGTVEAMRDSFHLSAAVLGFVVSAALLGCVVGAWFAGPLGDRHGRLRVMLGSAILFGISAIGCAASRGPIDLAVWRIIGGIAIGAASVIAPAYIAEIAPADLRGRLGSLQQLAIVSGIFLSLLVDYAIAAVAGGANAPLFGFAAWRWMFATAAVPALVYGVVSLQVPESPRYLVRKKQLDEARKVLARFVGGDVDARIKEIQRSLGADTGIKLGDLRGALFGLRPIVWTGILLSVFQQLVGINVIFYYSTTLWRAVGFTEHDALATSVVTSVTNIVTTLVAMSLIDRIGRKPLLLIGAAGMAVSLGTMAWAFSSATGSGDSLVLAPSAARLALIAANVYVFAFGMSWGPVVWVLLGEMFDNRIRATALAVAAAAQWIANWIVSISFPGLASIGLSFAYASYALAAAASFAFVWRAVKETRGRELEDM